MSESDRSDGIKRLFADTVRETMDGAAYGAWRTITAPEAVSLVFGFPYPDALPNEAIGDAFDVVLESDHEDALQYAGGDYADAITDTVVERSRSRGIECTAEEVHLTNGATHAIDTVAQTFLDPDDTIAVEAPSFMGALRLFRNYGVDIEGYELDENGLDVDAFAADLAAREAADEPLPKLLYTVPDFQNPTGVTLSADRRERLLELAELAVDARGLVVHPVDAHADEVVRVGLQFAVERPERAQGEGVALWTELGGRRELRAEHRPVDAVRSLPGLPLRVGGSLRVGALLGVPEPRSRVPRIEVQPGQIVAEGHVVDPPLLEEVTGGPVEGDVCLAGQDVVALEKFAGLGEVVGDKVAVLVEALLPARTEKGTETHGQTWTRVT